HQDEIKEELGENVGVHQLREQRKTSTGGDSRRGGELPADTRVDGGDKASGGAEEVSFARTLQPKQQHDSAEGEYGVWRPGGEAHRNPLLPGQADQRDE